MATVTEGGKSNWLANATLAQYTAVKEDSTAGQVVQATTATEVTLGIIQVAGVAGRSVAIKHRGSGDLSKVLYGGTIAVGDRLTPTTGGKVIATTTTGNEVLGRAVVAGVSGDTGVCELSNEKHY